MDYKKIYEKLMNKCLHEYNVRVTLKNNGKYFEKHHIQPKCLGGNNEKNNLVLLTAKEHYLSHHLLVKIWPGHKKLIYSFWMMCNGSLKSRPTPNQRLYENARKLFSKTIKGRVGPNTGKKHSEESKNKISKNKKGKCVGDQNHFFGKNHSNETIKKMSESAKSRIIIEKNELKRRKGISKGNKNKIFSLEQKNKIRISKLGERNPMYGKHGSNNPRSKSCYQYDKEMKLINRWDNAKIAASTLGLSYSSINECLRKKIKSSGGFIWKYE